MDPDDSDESIHKLDLMDTHRPMYLETVCPSISLVVQWFSSVQSLSHVQLFATPWTTAHQAFLSITNSWSLLKLTSINLVMDSVPMQGYGFEPRSWFLLTHSAPGSCSQINVHTLQSGEWGE